MTSITGSRDAISASFKSRVRVSLRLTSGRNCEHPGNVARKIVGQRQHQQKNSRNSLKSGKRSKFNYRSPVFVQNFIVLKVFKSSTTRPVLQEKLNSLKIMLVSQKFVKEISSIKSIVIATNAEWKSLRFKKIIIIERRKRFS